MKLIPSPEGTFLSYCDHSGQSFQIIKLPLPWAVLDDDYTYFEYTGQPENIFTGTHHIRTIYIYFGGIRFGKMGDTFPQTVHKGDSHVYNKIHLRME